MTNGGQERSNPKYGATMSEMPNGHLKVYNAGMVMFTNKGMQLARENLHPFQAYQDYNDPVV